MCRWRRRRQARAARLTNFSIYSGAGVRPSLEGLPYFFCMEVPHGLPDTVDALKYTCTECGGSGVCPHGRQKYTCTECGGSGVCAHGRQKRICKECGRRGTCAHGRIKGVCKECGGGHICSHGRIKYQCKDCGCRRICVHGRIKYQCKHCGGSSLCVHNRQKSKCKECGGSGLCVHMKQKHQCKECGQGGGRSSAQPLTMNDMNDPSRPETPRTGADVAAFLALHLPESETTSVTPKRPRGRPRKVASMIEVEVGNAQHRSRCSVSECGDEQLCT
jgi:hypothetical protein